MKKTINEEIGKIKNMMGLQEMGINDFHLQKILKYYDEGSPEVKNKVASLLVGKENADRDKVILAMRKMNLNDILDATNELGLTDDESEETPKHENYMFFNNIQQMRRQCSLLMNEDHSKIDEILKKHDWAQDHITEAKSLLDQVFDFLMNENKGNINENYLSEEYQIDESKNKPTNPKLWSRAKSMAKSKFKVYPSAYANGWAAKWYKKQGGGWRKSKK